MRFDVVVRSRVRGQDHVARNVFASGIRPGSVRGVLREAADDSWKHLSRSGRMPVRWLDLRRTDEHGLVTGAVWFWTDRKVVVVTAAPRREE